MVERERWPRVWPRPQVELVLWIVGTLTFAESVPNPRSRLGTLFLLSHLPHSSELSDRLVLLISLLGAKAPREHCKIETLDRRETRSNGRGDGGGSEGSGERLR